MEAGTLLFVNDYVFEDGTSKAKFFLVLKKINNSQALLISLPSSQDSVPSDKSNCVDLPNAQQSAFIFREGEIVTNTNFAFEKRTYLYGKSVAIKDIEDFNRNYPLEGVHFHNKGKLKTRILKAVLECFKNSCTINRKIKRML